jgi:hypothetical protein
MDTFYGPRPLYRWQLGLLFLSLPRRLIPAAGLKSSLPAPCGRCG